MITPLALLVASFAVGSCASQSHSACAPGLYEYKGTCLDAMSQNFVGSTAIRGQDLTVEHKKKFALSVDRAAAMKSVGGVVEISKKVVVETELPDVALVIVKDCLEFSKNLTSPVEQTNLRQHVDAMQALIDSTTKGTICLSPNRGLYGQEIDVSGTKWPPNVEVEVTAGVSKVRATTVAEGGFGTTVKLDPRFETVSPTTVEIRVALVKASTQVSASALYEIVK